MKKILLSGIALISLFLLACSAGGTKAEFYVRGNCGMCQERIETALKATPGVSSASWNVDTKMATVEFDSTKVTQAKLEEIVANVGHETKTNATPTAVH